MSNRCRLHRVLSDVSTTCYWSTVNSSSHYSHVFKFSIRTGVEFVFIHRALMLTINYYCHENLQLAVQVLACQNATTCLHAVTVNKLYTCSYRWNLCPITALQSLPSIKLVASNSSQWYLSEIYAPGLYEDEQYRVQKLCESRSGRPGLSVLKRLTVSVDVKQHWNHA